MNTMNEKVKDAEQQESTTNAQTPLHEYAHKGKKVISDRLNELDGEWDVERTLLLNAAVISLTGAFLGAFVNKRWFLLSAVAGFVMAEEALTGWSPPTAIMKKLGKRTREEIQRERTGLKAFKGDFKNAEDPAKVWEATE
jgi:hypothetical protein